MYPDLLSFFLKLYPETSGLRSEKRPSWRGEGSCTQHCYHPADYLVLYFLIQENKMLFLHSLLQLKLQLPRDFPLWQGKNRTYKRYTIRGYTKRQWSYHSFPPSLMPCPYESTISMPTMVASSDGLSSGTSGDLNWMSSPTNLGFCFWVLILGLWEYLFPRKWCTKWSHLSSWTPCLITKVQLNMIQ